MAVFFNLACRENDAEYAIKTADRPFPDSLLSLVYYDVNQWEPRFHEAGRLPIKFYQIRDTACLKSVQKLLDDFKTSIHISSIGSISFLNGKAAGYAFAASIAAPMAPA